MNYEEYEIIDAHAHIFPDKIIEAATEGISKFYGLPMHSIGSCDKLIAHGEVIGVTKYLVCSVATVPHQVSAINRFIAEASKKYPIFIGFGTLHPGSDSVEEEISEIKKLGLKGVKLHPDFQKFDMDSPGAYKIYEIISDELPLLIHCGDSRFEYSAPKRVANIHRDFPKMKTICAHFGGYERWDEAVDYIAGLENIFVDTSSSMAFMSKEYAMTLINKFGVDKCLFGTDFPMWRHEDEFKNIISLGLSRTDNQKIFADNFKNLF